MNGPITASAILLFASVLPAQQPKVSDTQFSTEPVGQNLAATVDQTLRCSKDQLWLGYEVPALPGLHLSTCSDSSNSSQSDDECCGEYRLEDEHGTHRNNNAWAQQNVYILFRYDKGDLVKLRTVGAGSASMPAELISPGSRQSSRKKASSSSLISSISRHKVPEFWKVRCWPSAFTPRRKRRSLWNRSRPRPHLGTPASRPLGGVWLGVRLGYDGFLALKSLESRTTEPEFREKLTFDFAQNSDPGAQDELIRMAKFDPEPKVRGQALFWMAQKAGKRATPALTDAIQNDPETAVKKRAVFALSQLPHDESVPQLIHVADTNTNVAVRKEAFFWLGQSQDPRALAYLEQVLKR